MGRASMSHERPTCETCRFFEGPGPLDSPVIHGQCHIRSQTTSEIGSKLYFFPPRRAHDWCGEHTPPPGPWKPIHENPPDPLEWERLQRTQATEENAS